MCGSTIKPNFHIRFIFSDQNLSPTVSNKEIKIQLILIKWNKNADSLSDSWWKINKDFFYKIIKYILIKWKENADLLSVSWWKINKYKENEMKINISVSQSVSEKEKINKNYKINVIMKMLILSLTVDVLIEKAAQRTQKVDKRERKEKEVKHSLHVFKQPFRFFFFLFVMQHQNTLRCSLSLS